MSVSVSVSEPEEASSSQESARDMDFLALEKGLEEVEEGLMLRLLRVLERSGRGVSCGVRGGKWEREINLPFGSTVMIAIELEL